jgi:hypothetical protein
VKKQRGSRPSPPRRPPAETASPLFLPGGRRSGWRPLRNATQARTGHCRSPILLPRISIIGSKTGVLAARREAGPKWQPSIEVLTLVHKQTPRHVFFVRRGGQKSRPARMLNRWAGVVANGVTAITACGDTRAPPCTFERGRRRMSSRRCFREPQPTGFFEGNRACPRQNFGEYKSDSCTTAGAPHSPPTPEPQPRGARRSFLAPPMPPRLDREGCLVCEAPMERKTEQHLVCGKPKCRNTLRTGIGFARGPGVVIPPRKASKIFLVHPGRRASSGCQV